MVSADGIYEAAERLKGYAVHTPLIENDLLNKRLGGRVLMKAEVLQHCGSFKFRGAFNRLSQLNADERKKGVLAWSSGNHAQGVARAARHFDLPAVIVMPADAPALKVEKVRAYGAQIITYDRYREDREAIGRPLAAEKGYALAPSYDHVDIIEGQGTAALEAASQAKALGVTMDEFVICCGGGGLTAGCATILKEVSPQTAITIAEPEGFAESWASIASGARCHADITQTTECDAIATPTPGRLTLPIMEKLVSGGVSLTQAEVRAAMIFAFKYLKLVLEPGGAVALAAVLAGHVPVRDKIVGLTLSGGNIDSDLFAQILAEDIGKIAP
ncbi:MAG: threonine/serine dehydratase [Pseudomonadota bacterium]